MILNMKKITFPALLSWLSGLGLIFIAVALLVLCWSFGEQAGRAKIRARYPSASSGMTPQRETGPRLEPGPVVNGVTPATRAALLETTLQRLGEIPAGRGFSTRLEEARLIKDLAQISTPQLQALVDALLEEGSTEAEEMAGRLLGPVLLVRDPAAVWAWIRDGAGSGSEGRIRFLSGTGGVFEAWAKRDPAAAIAAWRQEAQPLVQSGKLDGKGFWGIFKAWGESNPSAALEAAVQVTDPVMRESAAAGIAASLGKLFENEPGNWPPDADGIINRVLAFSGEKAGKGLQGLVKGRLRFQSPLEVAAWADQLQVSPGQKGMFEKALVDPWMETDPAAAASWYLGRIPAEDNAARSQALERSITGWTRVDDNSRVREIAAVPDLAAASDWLIAQGLGTTSQGAMTALARAWGQVREPEAAVAWARALPEEDARTQAMAAVTEEIRQRFPNDWPRYTQP